MNKFNFNTLVFTVLAGTSLILLFSACSAEKASDVNTETRSFPTTQPILMDTLLFEEFVADIQSPQYVEIRARVRGYLEKIHVDEGQEVQKGQLLFTLSGEGYREGLRLAEAAHRSAVAEAKMAEVEWKNTTILREKDIVSASELELAEAKLEAALARVEEAKAGVSAAELNLSFTEIKAPFSG
ncbi:MAG: efflux RND transporter periplasmic adaptor subunit, partial [Phaeodactylibacter sp.]|nr:efflux RND transporter periplasmic adaptor subunit [Phaeodactylibacter sp.]